MNNCITYVLLLWPLLIIFNGYRHKSKAIHRWKELVVLPHTRFGVRGKETKRNHGHGLGNMLDILMFIALYLPFSLKFSLFFTILQGTWEQKLFGLSEKKTLWILTLSLTSYDHYNFLIHKLNTIIRLDAFFPIHTLPFLILPYRLTLQISMSSFALWFLIPSNCWVWEIMC